MLDLMKLLALMLAAAGTLALAGCATGGGGMMQSTTGAAGDGSTTCLAGQVAVNGQCMAGGAARGKY